MDRKIINDIIKYGLIGCFDRYGNRIKMNKNTSLFPYIEDIPEYLLVIIPEALNYNFKYIEPEYGSIFSTLDVRQNFYKDWLPAVYRQSNFVTIDRLALKIVNNIYPTISKGEHIIKLADSGHKLSYYIFKKGCFARTGNSGSLTYVQVHGSSVSEYPERIQNWFRTLIGLPNIPKHNDIVDSFRYSVEFCHGYYYDKYIKSIQKLPEIKKVIFNDPATIVFWEDGTKTVVKNDDRYKSGKLKPYDPEKGLSMAISKKALGNDGKYYNEFKKWLSKEDK